jgi:hypothetical protein
MGLWFVLAGGILALIGGFFPSTRTVAASTASTDTDGSATHSHTD